MKLVTLVIAAIVLRVGLVRAGDLEPMTSSFAYAGRHQTKGFPSALEVAIQPFRIANTQSSNSPAMAICNAAYSVAADNSLPADFFLNLIQQESNFRSQAVSHAGAQGIAQFMPGTAADYGLRNPFDPVESLIASGKLLAQLMRQFGNVGLAAAGYNAGVTRVQDWLSHRRPLPLETRQYVSRITGHTAEEWRSDKPNDIGALPVRSSCTTFPTPAATVSHRTPQIKGFAQAIEGNHISLLISSKHSTVIHAMPQPSRFAIGRPVSPAILASEKAVLARYKGG